MTTREPLDIGTRYRLRIADYLRLAEADAFDGLRTELIEGDVVFVSPQYRPHGMVKMAIYDRLRGALAKLGSPLCAVVEVSVALDDHTMVDPDLQLTSEPYGEGPVPLASVALIIEVADTTLPKDLRVKARLYAGGAIPEYWVVDVNGGIVRQMWQPQGDAFAEQRDVPFGKTITAATIAGLTIAGLTIDTAGLR